MNKPPKTDWNEYARDYDRARILGRHRLLLEHHQEVLRDFLSFFSTVDPDARILDIGCASGFFLAVLRELGFDNLKGIDASEVFVARAREKGLACRVMDILDPVVEECELKYNVVLLMDTLEHLPDPIRALKNTRALFLKSDGVLFITVPLHDSVYDRWKRLRRRQTRLEQARMHDPTHIQAFSQEEVYALLGKAGFTAVSSKRLYCSLSFIPWRCARSAVSLLLPERLKGMFLRVVARPSAAGP